MKCPACGNVLTLMVAGDITVNVCELGCGGMWFDAFELSKVDETHESAGETLLDVKRKPGVHADPKRKRSCPKCGDVVMMRHFSSAKKQVEVDECPGCGGMWLDAGELAAIRSEFASEADRKRAADDYFTEVFGGQLAEMRAKSEATREKARKIAHVFRFICPSYYIPGKQPWGAF